MLIKLDQIEKGEEIAASVEELKNKATEADMKEIIPPEKSVVMPVGNNWSYYQYCDHTWEYTEENHKLPWDIVDCLFAGKMDAGNVSSICDREMTELPRYINCEKLTSLNNVFSCYYKITKGALFSDLTNCKTFSSMYDNCEKLESVPDFSRVAYRAIFDHTFFNCTSLKAAPKINGTIEKANDMFYQCKNLTEVPEYDLSKCGNYSSMFYGCESLVGEFPWTIDAECIEDAGGPAFMFQGSGITKAKFKNVNNIFNPDHPDFKYTLSSLIGKNKDNKDIEVVVENYLED